jgi:NAD(P)-dependent dehydrogenase (short-subunit alcohol dehydrogenase family)
VVNISESSAWVSGGASGLGEATVRRLHARGARVMIADRDAGKGEALAKELGERAAFSPVDVTDPAAVRASMEKAAAVAPLRIAVSCAGIGWASRVVGKDGAPHDTAPFEMVVKINLIGSFNVLAAAGATIARAPALDDGERGVIINTASVAAFDGQIGQIAYAASKAGVVGMTLPAARDLSSLGIRVVTIAPGLFDTPMLALLPEPARQALGASIPFPKRLGLPKEYAALAEHIVDSRYLNGEVIRLDGALRMAPK